MVSQKSSIFILIVFFSLARDIFTEKDEYKKQQETILLEQLLRLAEEHNLAECPPVSSGLPGSCLRFS